DFGWDVVVLSRRLSGVVHSALPGCDERRGLGFTRRSATPQRNRRPPERGVGDRDATGLHRHRRSETLATLRRDEGTTRRTKFGRPDFGFEQARAYGGADAARGEAL